MSEIDWNDVVEEAQVSARAILADWLALADEYVQIVLVGEKRDGEVFTAWTFESKQGDSSLTLVGLLETAKFELLSRQERG